MLVASCLFLSILDAPVAGLPLILFICFWWEPIRFYCRLTASKVLESPVAVLEAAGGHLRGVSSVVRLNDISK